MSMESKLKGKRCIGQIRCSTKEQARKSLPQQQAWLREYAGEHGMTYVTDMKEAVSASQIKRRPDLQRIMQRKKTLNDFDVVLVQDLSRLTRGGTEHGLELYFKFKELGLRIITENGVLVWPRGAAPPSARAAPPPQKLPRMCRTLMTPTRMKFIIKYTHRAHMSAFVHGAYMDGANIYVLYRISCVSAHQDGIMFTDGKRVFFQSAVPAEDCLPDSNWDFFLSLPAHATFKLKRLWRKMSDYEIEDIIEGRTFQATKRQRRD
jgi:hypothetical protein